MPCLHILLYAYFPVLLPLVLLVYILLVYTYTLYTLILSIDIIRAYGVHAQVQVVEMLNRYIGNPLHFRARCYLVLRGTNVT